MRPGLTLRDRFDWDLDQENQSPFIFAKRLVDAIGGEKQQEEWIGREVFEQVCDHLDKYAGWQGGRKSEVILDSLDDFATRRGRKPKAFYHTKIKMMTE